MKERLPASRPPPGGPPGGPVQPHAAQAANTTGGRSRRETRPHQPARKQARTNRQRTRPIQGERGEMTARPEKGREVGKSEAIGGFERGANPGRQHGACPTSCLHPKARGGRQGAAGHGVSQCTLGRSTVVARKENRSNSAARDLHRPGAAAPSQAAAVRQVGAVPGCEGPAEWWTPGRGCLSGPPGTPQETPGAAALRRCCPRAGARRRPWGRRSRAAPPSRGSGPRRGLQRRRGRAPSAWPPAPRCSRRGRSQRRPRSWPRPAVHPAESSQRAHTRAKGVVGSGRAPTESSQRAHVLEAWGSGWVGAGRLVQRGAAVGAAVGAAGVQWWVQRWVQEGADARTHGCWHRPPRLPSPARPPICRSAPLL